jgi:hypothetical protein
MMTFEYKVLSRPKATSTMLEYELNALGNEGWQLIFAMPNGMLILMRQA